MDRKFIFAALLAMTLAIASPALAVDKASAVLKDKDGKEVGKVELTDTPSGVLMRLTLDGVPPGDPAYPLIATTYRLTEHYLSGPMSRFDSWLNELQPEMFAEISSMTFSPAAMQKESRIS